MSVTISNFGNTRNGHPVMAYRLENPSGASVTVLDYGATVQSLIVPNGAGGMTDVVLGYDTALEYEENGGYVGATIGRVGNRIGGAAFRLNGHTYPLEKNDGENHLHGGRKGFDKQFWTILPLGDDSLVCSRLSPDGEEGYPGNLEVKVTFTLTSHNALRIQYDADTDQDTIVNLTNHSYFNLNGQGSVLDHELQVFASRITENDAGSLPTGRLLEVADTPFDFRAAKKIGAEIGAADLQLEYGNGYDHNFVLSGKTAAVLRSASTGIELTVETDMPGMQVYTANFLTERPGKYGTTMRPRDAVCLETQLFPNAMNCYGFPSPILHAGQHLHSETVFAFRTL